MVNFSFTSADQQNAGPGTRGNLRDLSNILGILPSEVGALLTQLDAVDESRRADIVVQRTTLSGLEAQDFLDQHYE